MEPNTSGCRVRGKKMDDSVKKALTNGEKCRRFQERLKAGVLFCAMETCLHSTLPRLRLLTQHCRWHRSTSWGKGWAVLLAKYMQQKRRTILQPDHKGEGMLFLPHLQQVRCQSKVNIQRPKPRHDARRLFEAITVPIILPEPIPHTEICARRRAQALERLNEVNPYEEFLVKQCKKMVQENHMIAVCQALPMSSEARKAAKNKLMKKGMNLHFFNNSLMRCAVEDSPFINLSPFLISRNMYVVSGEPCVADLIKTLRKIPELVLLGGLVDNHILTREGMLRCSKLPSLELVHRKLITILGSSASRTRSLLGSHQQMLAANLDQYIKQSQEGGSPPPSSKPSKEES